MKAMAPNPDNRYLSADDMLADLEEFRKNPSINFDYSASEFDPEEAIEDDRTQIRTVSTGSGRSVGERRYQEDYGQSRGYEDDYPSVSRRSRRSRQEEDYPQRWEDEEDDYPRRGPVWPVFLAAAAVLLFVGLVVYFLVNTIFPGMFAPVDTTPVPNLVGKVYEDVKGDSELLGRFTLIEGETVADEAEPGTIIDQDPKAEKKVGDTVTEITVTISGGPKIIPMPDLDGKDYSAASRELRELGLKPVAPPEYKYDDTIEEGYIISYTPLKGVELTPGTEVHMVVSKGPEEEEIPMPDLAGMTEAMARSTLDMYELTAGRFEPQYDDTVEEGKVVSQYPLKDTKVKKGATVNVIISKGPDPATQTPDPGTDPDPGNDPSLVTRVISVSLSGHSGTVNVRVLMDGSQVYSQDWDANMNMAVDVPIRGKAEMGTKELAIYIDGVLSHTDTVDFGS